jgi:hypothetical protein
MLCYCKLCITPHDNITIHHIKQKDSARRKCLQTCNSLGLERCFIMSELMEDWLGCVWKCQPGALQSLQIPLQCTHLVAISQVESKTGE